VRPGSLVLCHSPLTTAAAWGGLPDELRHRGLRPLVLDVRSDERPPYAASYVADASRQLAAGDPTAPTVLVGHSGAGPLLPPLAAAARAARRPVGAYVFLDAMLPRAGGATRLELLHSEDHGFAHELQAQLERGGRYPDWDDEALLALARPRDLGFFTEPLPHPSPDVLEWPDAPVGYLRTSEPYGWHTGIARQRRWPVVEVELGHFPGITAPAAAAGALAELLSALPG
jgi:hypothetical protein